MGMDQELAAIYGTPGASTPEDQTKVAQAHLFAKLAASNGIDLNTLSDDQVNTLWIETFKVAEAAPPAASDEEKKKAEEAKKEEEQKTAAAREFAAQQEWQTKVAECDKLGRIIAHSYVNELGKIAEAMKAANMPLPFGGAPAAPPAPPAEEKKEEAKEEKKEEGEKKEEKSEDEEKEASAIDQLAAKQALLIAKQAGANEKVAAKRLDAVLTLGAPATVKTASAKTLEQTVEIRALELLEAAGYPINWAQ